MKQGRGKPVGKLSPAAASFNDRFMRFKQLVEVT